MDSAFGFYGFAGARQILGGLCSRARFLFFLSGMNQDWQGVVEPFKHLLAFWL